MLLIEQFAAVALGLSNRAYVMEGGHIQYSGTAQELRDKPDLLHSAYLLRGAATGADTVPVAPLRVQREPADKRMSATARRQGA